MKYLTFDTETTGLPKDRRARVADTDMWPYVLQLSWALYDGDTNRLTYGDDIIRVAETVDISPSSIAVHGITRSRSERDGIPVGEAIRRFQAAMKQANVIIAHNLDFDKRMLMVECTRNKMRHEFYNTQIHYCTMKNSVNLCKIEAVSEKTGEKYYRYPKLAALHEHLFGTTPQGTHNALADILICFRCYYKMVLNADVSFRNRDIGRLLSRHCKV